MPSERINLCDNSCPSKPKSEGLGLKFRGSRSNERSQSRSTERSQSGANGTVMEEEAPFLCSSSTSSMTTPTSSSSSSASSSPPPSEDDFVLGIDLGTTTVRAFVYDKDCNVVGQSSDKVVLVYPQQGWVEIRPEQLWNSVKMVMREALKDAKKSAQEVRCLGISTQRATFITWDRDTGKEFHNFITWKDVRANELVQGWNKSFTMAALRFGASVLYHLTRQKRFLAGSIISLQNKMVNMRLLWALENIPSLREAARSNKAMFGTLDTWLLYKLTNQKVYLTDIGSVSATGLFDPFTLKYGKWAFDLFGIPMSLMPPVVDSAGSHFGSVDPEILGYPLPIRAVMADQSAAVFGSGCFNKGDTKMTLGTGSFLDVNTGKKPHASINGLVPLVGWRYDNNLCFLAEGSNHDTSSLIEWAKRLNLFDDPAETSDIAASVSDEDFSLYFVPAFFGLQAPISDPNAAAGFIGLSPGTDSKWILRSILESIAFMMKQLQETMEDESDYKLHNIQIDGGVSRNDFIVQLISSLTAKSIHRASSSEMSAFGAAFLAGLNTGVWSSTKELNRLRSIERTFQPNKDPEYLKKLHVHYEKWVDACFRFTNWNNDHS